MWNGISSLKWVTEAVCCLKYIDLSNDTIKTLGIHFFYNKTVQKQNKFITTMKKYSKFFVCGIRIQ